MNYVMMMTLALNLSISTLVFAQGEKTIPFSPTNAGLLIKPAAAEKMNTGLSQNAGPTLKAGSSEKNSYQVGIEDVLSISVIKPIPSTNSMTVTSDGTITFPYIGGVQAKGRTLSQIQSEIQNRLGDYMDYPIVSVSLMEAGSRQFTVYGQVAHPGSYPVQGEMSLLRALSIAGGLSIPGSTGMVKVLRPNKNDKGKAVIFDSDINAVLNGDRQDIPILAGDTVVVTIDMFFISGQVNHPGAYPVQEHMSLLNAISTAGGLTGATGMIKVLRPKLDDRPRQEFETDFVSVLDGTAPDVYIQARDTIVILANNFYVYGEVNRPGMYPLDSKTTALTAISIAGGFSKFGSGSHVKVVRMNEKTGSYETTKVNIQGAIQGNSKADVLLVPGDIVVVSEGLF